MDTLGDIAWVVYGTQQLPRGSCWGPRRGPGSSRPPAGHAGLRAFRNCRPEIPVSGRRGEANHYRRRGEAERDAERVQGRGPKR
jgi:hypothetical protein